MSGEPIQMPAALRDAVNALNNDEALCEVMSRMDFREVFKMGLMNGWARHERHVEAIAKIAENYRAAAQDKED